jgi:hypothetical protein
MVLMHLDGQNARFHAAVQAYETDLEQQKFFSAVKRRVLAKLRIDLSIPWKKQVHAVSGGAYQFFADENRASVPQALVPYCFTAAVTSEIVRDVELQLIRRANQMVKERAIKDRPVRRLAEIDVGPLEINPLLLDMNRLSVHTDVFEALKKVERPLYPLLTLHGLGCFGEITLIEVGQNWEALDRRRPVRSVFPAGRNQIVVVTDFRPDEFGELHPYVEVTAERRPLA